MSHSVNRSIARQILNQQIRPLARHSDVNRSVTNQIENLINRLRVYWSFTTYIQHLVSEEVSFCIENHPLDRPSQV